MRGGGSCPNDFVIDSDQLDAWAGEYWCPRLPWPPLPPGSRSEKSTRVTLVSVEIWTCTRMRLLVQKRSVTRTHARLRHNRIRMRHLDTKTNHKRLRHIVHLTHSFHPSHLRSYPSPLQHRLDKYFYKWPLTSLRLPLLHFPPIYLDTWCYIF